MDGLFEALGTSLGWLASQLLAGKLPRKILLIVIITTITGGVLAFSQAAQSLDNTLFWFASLKVCLGVVLGFVGGVALIWLAAWSLTPVWRISERFESPEVDALAHIFRADLPFSNAGYGAAKNLAVGFQAENGHQPVDATGLGNPATPEAIDTGQSHLVQLYWQRDKPLDGELVLTTVRKSGFGSEDKYHVRTYLSKSNPDQAWCDVRPRW